MKGNACLLVDLENFFLAREEWFEAIEAHDPGATYDFSSDLQNLVRFAEEMADGRRLVVRRAYADFNGWRPSGQFDEHGKERWEQFLRGAPAALMRRGVEPVQVFRFPGMAKKNAADMRLAMDATALLTGRADVEYFILVTGDSDFIPLATELRRAGATVAVIGLKHGTRRILPQFVDRFEYFESLLAVVQRQSPTDTEVALVRQALLEELELTSPLAVDAVDNVLNRALGRTFDPGRYDVHSTEEFLRRYSIELGVLLGKDEKSGWWVRSAGESGAYTGSSGRPSANLYRKLLIGTYGWGRGPRVSLYVAPPEEWRRVTQLVFDLCTTPGGAERPLIYHAVLRSELQDRLAEEEEEIDGDPYRTVPAALFQLFKSGCFRCAGEGPEFGRADFHWRLPARLDSGLEDVEAMRARVRGFLLRTLHERLVLAGHRRGIDPRTLAELFYGPDAGLPKAEEMRLALIAENLPVYESLDATEGDLVPVPRGALPKPVTHDAPHADERTSVDLPTSQS